MLELSAAQKEAIKKRIRRACCDMARKMGMTAAFTSTGIRVAQGSTAYVFNFKWNPSVTFATDVFVVDIVDVVVILVVSGFVVVVIPNVVIVVKFRVS